MSRALAPLCALLLLLLAAPVGAAPLSAVLGRAVAYTTGVEAVPKWKRLLDRLAREWPRYEACLARAGACPSDRARAWRDLLRRLGDRSRAAQVAAVDRFANAFPYRTDAEIWGRSDYWATPFEFLTRSGDCEDYAIFKYVSLRLLGVPARDMRLIVLQDTRRDVPHAVLEVRVDGRDLLLDNLAPRPRPVEAVRRYYHPYYAASTLDVHFPGRADGRLTLLRADRLRPAR